MMSGLLSRRRLRVVRHGALLLLAGCPYIFGPPDMSNVKDEGDGDDTTDGDADTDTDADGDADTDIDPVVPPVVTSFEISPRLLAMSIAFEVDDEQSDLSGGTLEISDGDDVYTLDIPADIDDWNGEGAPSYHMLDLDKTWLFPDLDAGAAYVPDCDAGEDATWTLTAVDAAGHRSEPLGNHLVIPAFGTLPEPDYPYVDAGAPPFVFCAEFEDALGSGRYTDIEAIEFTSATTGVYVFDLGWEKEVDLDILLYDLPTYEPVDTAYDGQGYGYIPPEDLVWSLVGGQDWVVQVRYWDIPLGTNDPPYLGRLLVTPE